MTGFAAAWCVLPPFSFTSSSCAVVGLFLDELGFLNGASDPPTPLESTDPDMYTWQRGMPIPPGEAARRVVRDVGGRVDGGENGLPVHQQLQGVGRGSVGGQ
eukprot:1191430-Prorocentrum_minimum.AAC.2